MDARSRMGAPAPGCGQGRQPRATTSSGWQHRTATQVSTDRRHCTGTGHPPRRSEAASLGLLTDPSTIRRIPMTILRTAVHERIDELDGGSDNLGEALRQVPTE